MTSIYSKPSQVSVLNKKEKYSFKEKCQVWIQGLASGLTFPIPAKGNLSLQIRGQYSGHMLCLNHAEASIIICTSWQLVLSNLNSQ